jgi:putative peptide zinc metalloprotease protein
VRADGLVWLPDEALVRAGTDGFVAEVLVADGAQVAAGHPIMHLVDPALPVEILKLEARLRGIDAALHLALFTAARDAGALLQDRTRTEAELERARARLEMLTLRAAAPGRLALARAEDLPGRFVARGQVLAQVLPDGGTPVRVVLAQDDARALARPEAIEVRLVDAPGRDWAARAKAQTPAATRELPSPLFGDRAGGSFATDPADSQGLRTREAVFTLDLELPSEAPLLVGSRAWVRFDQGQEPLAIQGLRRLRQLFLGRLAG